MTSLLGKKETEKGEKAKEEKNNREVGGGG